MIGNDMAFPVTDRAQTPNETVQLGLTKREYFAAAAMQGMLSNTQFVHFVCKKADEQDIPNGRVLADLAVGQADHLLAELEKVTAPPTPLEAAARCVVEGYHNPDVNGAEFMDRMKKLAEALK